jgi:hypothetical protein
MKIVYQKMQRNKNEQYTNIMESSFYSYDTQDFLVIDAQEDLGYEAYWKWSFRKSFYS